MQHVQIFFIFLSTITFITSLYPMEGNPKNDLSGLSWLQNGNNQQPWHHTVEEMSTPLPPYAAIC